MEVDGKPSMGMPSPALTVHCCVWYPERKGKGSCSGIGGVCVATGVGIKENFLGGITRRGEGYSERGNLEVVWGPYAYKI